MDKNPTLRMRGFTAETPTYKTSAITVFTEKFFVRVDVTEEFPFLVTKLSPYYDR